MDAVTAGELRAILGTHREFATLSTSTLRALARAAERVFVPAGRAVIRPGVPPEHAFVVEHGRLRGTEAQASARSGRPIVLEFGRGDVCGLGLLVAQVPAAGAVVAMRDTTVLRLHGEALLRCMATHPELVVAQARSFYETALRTHANLIAPPRIIALLPVSGAFAVDDIAGPLFSALTESLGPAIVMSSRRAADILGGAGRVLRRRLADLCDEQAAQGRLVLLVCDRDETEWTRWCLEQADRIVVAADAADTGAIDRARQHLAPYAIDGAPVMVDLLLVHPRDVAAPRGTRPWLELEHRRRHHHVRLDRPADFQRAARRIGERAVGVVLGGGGARSLAHIGVLQALEDAGVPVDVIGGTSMGAVVAAGYARGRSPREMLELFGEHVPDARVLRDLTFPRSSLLMGRKLDDVLRFAFEDLDMSDLWVPCFCISADLVDAQMIVHERGLLWEAVRASCSLPGIFPPVVSEGRLLVDGGLVDNVPIAVMEREHAASTIIAIDVGAAGIARGEGEAPRTRRGQRRRDGAPGIMRTLTASTMLGSKEELRRLVDEGHADLFLVPPVHHIKLLGFDARESLFTIGYDYARRRLAEWSGLAGLAGTSAARAPSSDAAPPEHRASS